MNTNNQTTIVEVFPDRSKAEYAVEELLRNGFDAADVGIVLSSGTDAQAFAPAHTRVIAGAEVGAVAGVALGSLAGIALGTVVLPGVGAVIAGGLLAGLLEGVAAGATGGSLLGALIGMSVPEDEARVYEREFHSGQTLVTVRTSGRYDEAAAILKQAQERVPVVHQHRSRLAALAEGGAESGDGAGRAFVPQP